MSTRINVADDPEAERFRSALQGPIEIVIEDATAYWAEDGNVRLGPESSASVEPLSTIARAVARGTDPARLALWARLRDGRAHQVGTGIGIARAAARATRHEP
jgi:hypothetical protein